MTTIALKVTNKFKDLKDVDWPTFSDGKVPQYDAASGKLKGVTPSSGGGAVWPILHVTGNTTLDATNVVVVGNNTSEITITLPLASDVGSVRYWISTSSLHDIVLDTGSSSHNIVTNEGGGRIYRLTPAKGYIGLVSEPTSGHWYAIESFIDPPPPTIAVTDVDTNVSLSARLLIFPDGSLADKGDGKAQISFFVPPPTTPTDFGAPNQMAHDNAYLYVCIDWFVWVRTPLATWT